MGGSSGGSQTVTNKTEIDPVTQAWRTSILNAGNAQFQQGYPNYYPGSTVVPFADQTQTGLQMMQDRAMQGAPQYDAAMSAAGRSFQQNPASTYAQQFASGQSPFITGIQQAGQNGVAAQANSMITPSYAQQLAQTGAQGTTAGVNTLQGIAQGGGENPALRGLFDQGAEQISNAVNANFMQAGRSGPNAAHTGALTRELGSLWNQIYMPAYENQQTRAQGAATSLAGIQQNDRAAAMQGLSAAGGLNLDQAGLFGSLASNDAARNLQAQTAAGQAGMQGAGLFGDMWSQGNQDTQRMAALLPSLYDYGGMPARDMMGVGGAYEGLAGEYLQDDMTRYNYPYQAGWDHLNNYASLMNGLPDFSNNNTTSPLPQQNRALGAMGGAMSGAKIGSQIYPGWGTAIGAIAGGLFGGYA